MQKNFIFSILIIFIFFLVGFFLISQTNRIVRPANIKMVNLAGQNIIVDVATEEDQHERGLSGRASLKENEGMLFVFAQPGKYPFWMKDMNFPIDIIWIAEDMKIIYIKKDVRPELYPESYGPANIPTQIGIPTEVGTKYVLEVVTGFSDKNNLKVGDRVEFTY